MTVLNLTLNSFRNLRGLDSEILTVPLSDGINILCGDNAQGKTNFIEALYFCATARSHRSGGHRELINFTSDAARVSVSVRGAFGSNIRIDALLRRSGGKAFAINALPVSKLSELFGALSIVIFSPEDLSLVKSGPSERRRFLDMGLCQFQILYYNALKQYYQSLKQRNSLLKSLRGRTGGGLYDTLSLWDEQLSEYGAQLNERRAGYIFKLNEAASAEHSRITSNKNLRAAERLEIIYKPSIEGGVSAYLEKLKKTRDRDVITGTTGHGAHKDDILFMINGQDARVFGSQGQQRTIALSLKLAELRLLTEEKNEPPLLLLDDVMSELDRGRQECLLDVVNTGQSIITCTGVEDVLRDIKSKTTFLTVQNGIIRG